MPSIGRVAYLVAQALISFGPMRTLQELRQESELMALDEFCLLPTQVTQGVIQEISIPHALQKA